MGAGRLPFCRRRTLNVLNMQALLSNISVIWVLRLGVFLFPSLPFSVFYDLYVAHGENSIRRPAP